MKWIPNGLTLLNLSCGFIILVYQDLLMTFICVSISCGADILDGAVARRLKVNSNLGIQLDSLADLVSFIVAPSLLYYQHFLNGSENHSILNILPLIFFVSMGALRLAIFNISPSTFDFKGLATPAAGITLVGVLLLQYKFQIDQSITKSIFYIIPLVLAFLMVSNFQMFSLKGVSKNPTKRLFLSLVVLVGLISLLFSPYCSVLSITVSYILFSIIYHFLMNRK